MIKREVKLIKKGDAKQFLFSKVRIVTEAMIKMYKY